MKQQRDKLLELKNKEREKRLSTFTETQSKRPSSARTARQAVTGSPITELPSDEDKKKIEMRRALAARLKREVVDQ